MMKDRVIQMDFKDMRLINAYFPSGTTGDERQDFKYKWLDEFYIYLNESEEEISKTYCYAVIIISPIRK